MSGLAVPAAVAPLAPLAAVAILAPAVDVRLHAVLPMIRALVVDADVSDGVARVGGAIGVLLTRVPGGADGAGPRLARDAARDVRPARDRGSPNRAAGGSDDARPDACGLRRALLASGASHSPAQGRGLLASCYLRRSWMRPRRSCESRASLASLASSLDASARLPLRARLCDVGKARVRQHRGHRVAGCVFRATHIEDVGIDGSRVRGARRSGEIDEQG